jgi:hypothetical protein
VSVDPRGRRVAVVADALLPELLDRLEREGYGVIQLPPTGLDPETERLWLEQVSEHVAEFLRTGYEVVLADDGRHAAELPPLPPYPP